MSASLILDLSYSRLVYFIPDLSTALMISSLSNDALARLCTFPTQEQRAKDQRSRVEQGTKTTPGSVGDVGKVKRPHRCRLTRASTERQVAVCLRYQADT